MSQLSKLINDGELIIKLRMDNEFNTDNYNEIKEELKSNVTEWKKIGAVPADDVVALISLIDFLAGGSRFWSYEVSIQVEDAVIELEEIIADLL